MKKASGKGAVFRPGGELGNVAADDGMGKTLSLWNFFTLFLKPGPGVSQKSSERKKRSIQNLLPKLNLKNKQNLLIMKILLAIIAAVIGMSFSSTTAEAGGKGPRKHYHFTKTYIVKIKTERGWQVKYRGTNYAYAKSKANYYRAHGCYVVFY